MIVRMNQFFTGICDGKFFSDNEFNLLTYNGDGNIVWTTYTCVYVMLDNGYLPQSCTLIDKLWWSKWLESMRKDIECTFGILKGRWQILKSGVRISGVHKIDKI